MLAAQQAEMNRDRKARKKPFGIDEFFVYPDQSDRDYIDVIYGAAAKELIRIRKFPLWGLFIYKELMESPGSEQKKPPTLLCYQNEEAIMLAPQVNDGICKCMLIAMESASNKILHMESPCGKTVKAKMPEVTSKMIAEENCYIDVY